MTFRFDDAVQTISILVHISRSLLPSSLNNWPIYLSAGLVSAPSILMFNVGFSTFLFMTGHCFGFLHCHELSI